MRFQIGEKLLVINFDIKNKANGTELCSYFFMPWEYDIIKINIRTLEVTEHHKVPDEYDEDQSNKKHDGYILHDIGVEKPFTWYNQFPKAHYGQLSDKSNYIFENHFPLENGDYMDEYILLSHYLENVINGIRQCEKLKAAANESQVAVQNDIDGISFLKKHYEEVEKILAEQHKLKVISKPYEIKLTDGTTKTFDFMKVVTFEPIE